MNRKKKELLLIILLISFSFIFIGSCMIPVAIGDASQHEEKNNLIKPYICSVCSGWLYYVSPLDNMVYKVKTDGSSRKLISNDKAVFSSLTVSNGNVYYIKQDDFKLYRISTNSKNKSKVSDKEIQTAYDGYFIYNGSIYYYNDSDELYKVSSGKLKKQDGKSEIIAATGCNSVIYKNFLYSWKMDGIYKTDLNTLKSICIYGGSFYPQFETGSDRIFYTSEDCMNIYSVSINGGKSQKIIDGIIAAEGPDYTLGRFKVSNGRIYYIDYKNNDYGILYSTDINGKNKKVISNKALDFITTADSIYYFDSSDNGKLYKYSLGSGKTEYIASGDFTYFADCHQNAVLFGMKSDNPEEYQYGKMFAVKPDGRSFFELK